MRHSHHLWSRPCPLLVLVPVLKLWIHVLDSKVSACEWSRPPAVEMIYDVPLGKPSFFFSFFSSSPSIPFSSALWLLTQSHKGRSCTYLQPCHCPSYPILSLCMGLSCVLFTAWTISSHLSRLTSNANSLYNSPRSSFIIILYKALLFKWCLFYERAICLHT